MSELTTTVVDHIGLLITNDPSLGEGPLGLVRDASVVFAGERIISVGPVSYTHLRAHETVLDLVCRLLLEKKNNPKHSVNSLRLTTHKYH